MKSLFRTIAAVICLLTSSLCVWLLFQKAVGRSGIDRTEQRLYTLSDGTRNILGKLNQRVKLKLYFSRTAVLDGPPDIGKFNDQFRFVRDLLQEYEDLSGSKITLEVVDPRRFSDEEEDATGHGLVGRPIAKGTAGNMDLLFFGLVAQTDLGKVKTIPFFWEGWWEFAEYKISKLLSDVTRREKKTVGVLSSLQVMGASPMMMQMYQMQGRRPPMPWLLVRQLGEQYDVKAVEKDTETVDGKLDFLIVIHPKDLPAKTLFAIDQYVMGGGRLLVFVDPNCLGDPPPPPDRSNPYAPPPPHSTASDLNALLKGWGVEMMPGAVAADGALGQQLRRQDAVPLITFLKLGKESGNAKEVISANLHNVNMIFAGVLKDVSGDQIQVIPLLSTTQTGSTWTPGRMPMFRMIDATRIRQEVADGTKPLMLACRIQGKLKTNFPDGVTIQDKAPSPPGGEEEPPQAPTTRQVDPTHLASEKAQVMVVADVDMITDQLAFASGQDMITGALVYEARGGNSALVQNALEFLGGSSDLTAIRSRGQFRRSFTVVDEIEKEAAKKTAEKEKKLDREIDDFNKELRKLSDQYDGENAAFIEGQLIKKRQKIQEDLRRTRKEKRRLKADMREEIEALENRLFWHNAIWAAAAVLLVAVGLAFFRYFRARYYVGRRV